MTFQKVSADTYIVPAKRSAVTGKYSKGSSMITPQITTTIKQLEALDPDTAVLDSGGEAWLAGDARHGDGSWVLAYTNHLPAVVIATGNQVRAAREALGEQA